MNDISKEQLEKWKVQKQQAKQRSIMIMQELSDYTLMCLQDDNIDTVSVKNIAQLNVVVMTLVVDYNELAKLADMKQSVIDLNYNNEQLLAMDNANENQFDSSFAYPLWQANIEN
ncbi:MAG: hypothetical protein LBK70_00330 [Clostridiales bacterium]|jgi:hypothetical protein|nr:hypothetical protein [Clostridiales bacterium]